MADPANPEDGALAIRSRPSGRPEPAEGRRDGALEAALERLDQGQRALKKGTGVISSSDHVQGPETHPPLERPDTPDLHVTAVRRLPAMSAQYAPFPSELDPRLRRAL